MLYHGTSNILLLYHSSKIITRSISAITRPYRPLHHSILRNNCITWVGINTGHYPGI